VGEDTGEEIKGRGSKEHKRGKKKMGEEMKEYKKWQKKKRIKKKK
jgi:hypothetical protein